MRWAGCVTILGERFIGGENSNCKVPEVGISLTCWRRQQTGRRRTVGDELEGVGRAVVSRAVAARMEGYRWLEAQGVLSRAMPWHYLLVVTINILGWRWLTAFQHPLLLSYYRILEKGLRKKERKKSPYISQPPLQLSMANAQNSGQWDAGSLLFPPSSLTWWPEVLQPFWTMRCPKIRAMPRRAMDK